MALVKDFAVKLRQEEVKVAEKQKMAVTKVHGRSFSFWRNFNIFQKLESPNTPSL